MKKIIFIAALLLSVFVFETVHAQITVGFKSNVGLQPVWGPVGYDHVEYYYMPDIDAYYNVPNRQYIYMQNGRWMFTPALPVRLRNFDLNSGYKVVINEAKPYRNAAMNRKKYVSYKGRMDQEIIRNSNDVKYYKIKDHPQHIKWKQGNKGKQK